jgi:hypothetical protein
MEDLLMDANKPASGDAEANALVANDASASKGTLRERGGSQSEDWNYTLVEQAIGTLRLKHSDQEASHRQRQATLAELP